MAFALWYDSWGGPLTAPEIERILARLQAQSAVEPERLAAVRAFLEADDGREFFMVNVIRLHPEPVPMPGSGEPTPARRVLEGYTGPFLRALFLRAGHPAFAGPAADRNLEQWGVAPGMLVVGPRVWVALVLALLAALGHLALNALRGV